MARRLRGNAGGLNMNPRSGPVPPAGGSATPPAVYANRLVLPPHRALEAFGTRYSETRGNATPAQLSVVDRGLQRQTSRVEAADQLGGAHRLARLGKAGAGRHPGDDVGHRL